MNVNLDDLQSFYKLRRQNLPHQSLELDNKVFERSGNSGLQF